MPYVFAGMEVGIVLAIIGAMVGEYLGGNEGLGYLVVADAQRARRTGPVRHDHAAVRSSGWCCTSRSTALKRFVIPWHESVYGQHDVNG